MDYNYDLNEPRIELPNATVVLVLGIVSIVGCCCWGIVGITCGIVALVLAKSATDLYVFNPGRFTEQSYKNVNAGKICALIGIILSALHIIRILVLLILQGFTAITHPQSIIDKIL